MSCAYVVLAHNNPGQVGRLAARLGPSPVFLHVDSRVGLAGMQRFEHAVGSLPHVSFVARHRSGWASWRIVAAALEGMRTAMGDERWSHLSLLSGQDCPLVASAEIDAFVAKHPATSLMWLWVMPSDEWGPTGGMLRLRYRHLPLRGRRVFLPVPRRLPKGFEPFGGSMYWVLTRQAVVDALAFADARPDVVAENLTYIRWPADEPAHPDLLGPADVPEPDLTALARVGAESLSQRAEEGRGEIALV